MVSVIPAQPLLVCEQVSMQTGVHISKESRQQTHAQANMAAAFLSEQKLQTKFSLFESKLASIFVSLQRLSKRMSRMNTLNTSLMALQYLKSRFGNSPLPWSDVFSFPKIALILDLHHSTVSSITQFVWDKCKTLS